MVASDINQAFSYKWLSFSKYFVFWNSPQEIQGTVVFRLHSCDPVMSFSNLLFASTSDRTGMPRKMASWSCPQHDFGSKMFFRDQTLPGLKRDTGFCKVNFQFALHLALSDPIHIPWHDKGLFFFYMRWHFAARWSQVTCWVSILYAHSTGNMHINAAIRRNLHTAVATVFSSMYKCKKNTGWRLTEMFLCFEIMLCPEDAH